MKRLNIALIVALMLSFTLAGCRISGKDIGPYVAHWTAGNEAAAIGEEPSMEDVKLKVLFLHGADGIRNNAVKHHLQQTLAAGVEFAAQSVDEAQLDPSVDLVYLDDGLQDDERFPEIREALMAYVRQGGILYLSHEYARAFPADFTGIAEMADITDTALDFSYPDVRGNLRGLQNVWKQFAGVYAHYEGLNPKYHIDFREGAVLGEGAVSLVQKGGLSLLSANRAGDGTVIWSNRFLPGEQFITRFDLVPEEGQKYFHFGYAAANYLFRTELVKFASKEKHGFSLQKAYGPYGRPGLAWQAHYEALYSFYLKDMIAFTDLLEKHNQVPTFSIVRGSYNGGMWLETMRFLENVGTDDEPDFVNAEDHSYFSAGQSIRTTKEILRLERLPGYRTFLSDVSEPYRAYPTIADWDGDGRPDLLVGSYNGRVYLLKRAGRDPLTFEEPAEVKNVRAESSAAPFAADWNGDGHFDLLLGDGEGRVILYENNGRQSFVRKGPLQAGGRPLEVAGPSAPFAIDWDGDGVLDLLVGDGEGRVHLFKGTAAGSLAMSAGEPLAADGEPFSVGLHAAPFATDWNGDGRLDVLVGGGNGEIVLLLGQEGGTLTNAGPLTGQQYNFFGTRTINVGHNAVPIVADWNGDGKKDLLTGHLEYGSPYAIDDPQFPYPDDLKKSIDYVRKRHLPLIPHMYLHEYMTDEREKREMELHREAFRALGIEWDDDMGVNHHTWRINKNALQTFRNQREAGIWWNFGFNPPNVSTAPRDGVEFLLTVPFLLADDGADADAAPFILFSPAPNALNFPKAWDSLAAFDVPLTYFEHIEHNMKPGQGIYDRIVQVIGFLNEFREAHKYTFMTEEQMARSLLNTFFADVRVRTDGTRLVLVPDYSGVPDKVREYARTLGVKLELGEALADKQVDTSGMFYYEGPTGFYLGVEDTVTVELVETSSMKDRIHLVRSNGPVRVKTDGNRLTLELSAKGMQEAEIRSPVPLAITGDDLRIEAKDGSYTIIHFGESAKVTVRVK